GAGARPRARSARRPNRRAAGGEDGPRGSLHEADEGRGHVNGAPATAKDPIHARVAGALERAFNPIMLKELRASLRGIRFFVAPIVILCLFAAGLMIAFVAMIPSRPGGYDDPGDPSDVGRHVYLITQFLQLGVAFLVVPGLAATSISSERESLTHD